MFERTAIALTFVLTSTYLATGCGASDSSSNGSKEGEAPCRGAAEQCADRRDVWRVDTGSGDASLEPNGRDTADMEETGVHSDATRSNDTARVDTSRSDTARPDAGSPDAADDRFVRRGRIDLVQDRTDSIQNRSTVSTTARFQVLDPEESPRTSCRHFRSAHCQVRACDTNGRTAAPGIEYVSAGDIAITGGERDVTLSLDDRDNRYGKSLDSPLWTEYSTLTFDAAGEVVPSFSVDLKPAEGVTVTKPDLPGAFESFEIDASKDFDLVWKARGSSEGNFLAEFNGLARNDRTVQMICEWPIEREQATIPKRLLSKFTPDANVTYDFGAGDRKTLRVGDFEVAVRALDVAADDDSGTWAGNGSARIVE